MVMRIWNLFGLINVCRQLSWRLGLRRQTVEKCHTETSKKLEPEDRRQDKGERGAMVQFSGVPKGGGSWGRMAFAVELLHACVFVCYWRGAEGEE